MRRFTPVHKIVPLEFQFWLLTDEHLGCFLSIGVRLGNTLELLKLLELPYKISIPVVYLP
jgi:hypothetical protein